MAGLVIIPANPNGVVHVASGEQSVSAVVESDLSFSNVTTADTTTSAHGLAPKGTVGTTQFWRQDWTLAAPSGAGNVTTSATLTSGTLVQGNGGTDVTLNATSATVTKLTSGVPSAATDGTDYLSPTTGLTWIAQATPSATGTVTFSSLGAFTHLQIVYSARSDKAAVNAEDLIVQFNADTGGNYDSELFYNPGATTIASFEQAAATSGIIGILPAATATAGRAGGGTIVIQDYRGTTFDKVATANVHAAVGTTTGLILLRNFGVTWRNTAAITAIALKLASGNFVSGSKFTLYGLP